MVSTHCTTIKKWDSPTQSFHNVKQTTLHNLCVLNIAWQSCFCVWSGVEVVLVVNFQTNQLVNSSSQTIAPPSNSEIDPLIHFRTQNKPPGTTFVASTLQHRVCFHGWSGVWVVLMVNFQKNQPIVVSKHCTTIKKWDSSTQSFQDTKQTTRHNLCALNIAWESCFHGWSGVEWRWLWWSISKKAN